MWPGDHARYNEAQDPGQLELPEQEQDARGQTKDDDEFTEEWEVHANS